MALSLFGKRSVAKRDSARVGPMASDLDTRMVAARQQGGGIQPNAHPEYEQATPLDKFVSGARKVAKYFTSKGKK